MRVAEWVGDVKARILAWGFRELLHTDGGELLNGVGDVGVGGLRRDPASEKWLMALEFK